MKYKVMQELAVSSDTLNYGLPVGEVGYVISVDYKIETALPYCIRIPRTQEQWWIPECDLMPKEEWLKKSVDDVVNHSMVNFALETKDKQLFDSYSLKLKEGDQKRRR